MLKQAVLSELHEKGQLEGFDKEASDKAIDVILDEVLGVINKYASLERLEADLEEALDKEAAPAPGTVPPPAAKPNLAIRALKGMVKHPIGTAFAGLGLTSAAALAYAAYNAWRRKQWGEEGISRTKHDPGRVLAQLRGEALQREDQQRQSLEDYRAHFQRSPFGGYVDPDTGALIGEAALHKRVGSMAAKAEDERNRWYAKELRKRSGGNGYEDPNTGVWVNPLPTAEGPENIADRGYGEFKAKMNEDRGLLRQMTGDLFLHKGSLVSGANSPWRGMWGQDVYQGPNAEGALQNYYKSLKTDASGVPLSPTM